MTPWMAWNRSLVLDPTNASVPLLPIGPVLPSPDGRLLFHVLSSNSWNFRIFQEGASCITAKKVPIVFKTGLLKGMACCAIGMSKCNQERQCECWHELQTIAREYFGVWRVGIVDVVEMNQHVECCRCGIVTLIECRV